MRDTKNCIYMNSAGECVNFILWNIRRCIDEQLFCSKQKIFNLVFQDWVYFLPIGGLLLTIIDDRPNDFLEVEGANLCF